MKEETGTSYNTGDFEIKIPCRWISDTDGKGKLNSQLRELFDTLNKIQKAEINIGQNITNKGDGNWKTQETEIKVALELN